jgi:hypothetical protein
MRKKVPCIYTGVIAYIFLPTTTWSSCNNNAEHRHGSKNNPQKNIFAHNPFYCILWKSTVYLPYVSFKTKTPRLQNVAFSKEILVQLSDQVLADRNQKVLFIGNVSRLR